MRGGGGGGGEYQKPLKAGHHRPASERHFNGVSLGANIE